MIEKLTGWQSSTGDSVSPSDSAGSVTTLLRLSISPPISRMRSWALLILPLHGQARPARVCSFSPSVLRTRLPPLESSTWPISLRWPRSLETSSSSSWLATSTLSRLPAVMSALRGLLLSRPRLLRLRARRRSSHLARGIRLSWRRWVSCARIFLCAVIMY